MSNVDFVKQLEKLNIDIATSDIDVWFQTDGPGYEHMDDQSIIDLVSSEDGEMMDEDEEKASDLETTGQQLKCSVSHAEAFRMFDQCFIWLRFQQEASLANTSTNNGAVARISC